MEALIIRAIENEAKKRLGRYSQNQYFVHKYRKSFQKRTGVVAKVKCHLTPGHWDFHQHFDPRYCLNHSRFLAKGLWRSLQAGTYKPTPARRVRLPKTSGGFRCIDMFSIPDAAIAGIFMVRLRLRNQTIFSDSSYAYQENKTPLDAVIKVKSLLGFGKVFVSHFDFQKYFDSIEHDHIERLLERSGPFLTTKMERSALKAVMAHDYIENEETHKRGCGIPQGNSLSLFLANLAAHPLDIELSKLNGAFARFADDVIVINYSYEDAIKCSNLIQNFCKNCGLSINSEKSLGINILSQGKAELSSIPEFSFLSYKFTQGGVGVGDRSILSIKRRCAKIVYNHLLLHPRRVRKFNPDRLGRGFRDWDLITCINELRSYIYGARSQEFIDNLLTGSARVGNLTGAVSYFCLVEDSSVFRELDGWLVDIVYRGYAERIKLLNRLGAIKSKPAYNHISKNQIRDGSWFNFKALPQETVLPSFFLAWRAARLSWARHGLGGIDPYGMGYSYDQ